MPSGWPVSSNVGGLSLSGAARRAAAMAEAMGRDDQPTRYSGQAAAGWIGQLIACPLPHIVIFFDRVPRKSKFNASM